MIVARIEIWPRGDSRALREIERVTIVNVGRSGEGYHLYEARHAGLVAAFRHRRADGATVLLTRALAALLERGEPDPLAGAAASEATDESGPASRDRPGLGPLSAAGTDDAEG